MHQLPCSPREMDFGFTHNTTKETLKQCLMKVTRMFIDLIQGFEMDVTKLCSIGVNIDRRRHKRIAINRSIILTQPLMKSHLHPISWWRQCVEEYMLANWNHLEVYIYSLHKSFPECLIPKYLHNPKMSNPKMSNPTMSNAKMSNRVIISTVPGESTWNV